LAYFVIYDKTKTKIKTYVYDSEVITNPYDYKISLVDIIEEYPEAYYFRVCCGTNGNVFALGNLSNYYTDREIQKISS
jgi:hypothetical protein